MKWVASPLFKKYLVWNTGWSCYIGNQAKASHSIGPLEADAVVLIDQVGLACINCAWWGHSITLDGACGCSVILQATFWAAINLICAQILSHLKWNKMVVIFNPQKFGFRTQGLPINGITFWTPYHFSSVFGIPPPLPNVLWFLGWNRPLTSPTTWPLFVTFWSDPSPLPRPGGIN